MKMSGNLLSSFDRRNLHTNIISTEIIKPSYPTPSHPKTHNLTLLEQIVALDSFIPLVLFYPKTDNRNFNDKTLDLKRSLSQILTKYYPFAGRHAKTAPTIVDCNDHGAEFHVGSIDTTLSDFLQNMQHEDLDHFFPYRQAWRRSDRKIQSNELIPVLGVQTNHFQCGGMAVAVSLSHKVGDASSCFYFVHDWAQTTQLCSRELEHPELPSDPYFVSHPYVTTNMNSSEVVTPDERKDCVTRTFTFPNSKINELKLKLKSAMITSPTRVDVLTWLLYKCVVEAAAKVNNNSGNFIPNNVYSAINIRKRMIEPLPEKSIGNLAMLMEFSTKKESEMNPESFICALQKEKMKTQSIRNYIEAGNGLLQKMSLETTSKEHTKNQVTNYFFSSVCGSPAYDTDFGWGKPVKVTFAPAYVINGFFLMDAPNGDGIEAIVCLEKEVMDIFESHPELLEFC